MLLDHVPSVDARSRAPLCEGVFLRMPVKTWGWQGADRWTVFLRLRGSVDPERVTYVAHDLRD